MTPIRKRIGKDKEARNTKPEGERDIAIKDQDRYNRSSIPYDQGQDQQGVDLS